MPRHLAMTQLTEELKREARVAFSPKAQPIWFRVLKWMVFCGVTAYFWGTPQLWLWITGALLLGVAVHLLWRRKTKGWTQPWLGWDDTARAAGEQEEAVTEWKTQL